MLVLAFGYTMVPHGASPSLAAPVSAPVHPLNNNCSDGYVTFTFDDGPGPYTQKVISELRALHVSAVFFVIGEHVAAHPQLVREEIADGYVVGDHTWDHQSLTGWSTPGTKPLTDVHVKAELNKTIQAIVAAGAPRPTLWRPPYGDVTGHDNALAHALGLRLVLSYGTSTGDIVDSRDWDGLSPSQVVHNITHGYTVDGTFIPGIHRGSILSAHDGISETPTTVAALQGIVDYMNAHHLCATTTVPADATGGVIPDNDPRRGRMTVTSRRWPPGRSHSDRFRE